MKQLEMRDQCAGVLERGLEELPLNWTLETSKKRTATGLGTLQAAYVCPVTNARFARLADALLHAEQHPGELPPPRKAEPVFAAMPNGTAIRPFIVLVRK